MNTKINEYLHQDIDNPKYLFHGSSYKLNKIIPKTSQDSTGNVDNIATAIFLFPSFLNATPYAFMKTIIANSEKLDWSFEIPNSNTFPLMTMSNVNINENIIGYIYVFEKNDRMIKDEKSYQYKCYEELVPFDIVTIDYKDFSRYYKLRTTDKSMNYRK